MLFSFNIMFYGLLKTKITLRPMKRTFNTKLLTYLKCVHVYEISILYLIRALFNSAFGLKKAVGL